MSETEPQKLTAGSIGLNVLKLVCIKAARDMVPDGSGLLGAVGAIIEPGRLSKSMRIAVEFVRGSIAMIKVAPDNPYGDDDEVIAGVILARIEASRPLSSSEKLLMRECKAKASRELELQKE